MRYTEKIQFKIPIPFVTSESRAVHEVVVLFVSFVLEFHLPEFISQIDAKRTESYLTRAGQGKTFSCQISFHDHVFVERVTRSKGDAGFIVKELLPDGETI